MKIKTKCKDYKADKGIMIIDVTIEDLEIAIPNCSPKKIDKVCQNFKPGDNIEIITTGQKGIVGADKAPKGKISVILAGDDGSFEIHNFRPDEIRKTKGGFG